MSRVCRKNDAEDDEDRPEDHAGLDDAEEATQDLVDEARLLEQRLRLVEALGDEGEGERRGDEDRAGTRSCSCIPWGTGSSSCRGSRRAARRCWPRRRTRTAPTPGRSGGGSCPGRSPSTKKPAKYRKRSRSTLLIPLRNSPISTHSPRLRSPLTPAGGQGGARVAAPIQRVARPSADGRVRCRPVRCGCEPPASVASPAVTAATAASTSASSRVRSRGVERQAVGQASARRRPAVGRGRCRTGSTPRRSGPPWRSDRAATVAGRRSTVGTTTARSRSTAGKRDGVRPAWHDRRAAGQPGDGQLGDDDPVGPRLERLVDGGMELADPRRAGRPRRGARRGPTRMEDRIVGRAARSRASAGRADARAARAGPSRRRGRTAAPGGSRPAARPCRSGEPEPPPLVRRARPPAAP